MIIKNYAVKGSTFGTPPTGENVTVLTGATNGTIVKSLELNTGSSASVVNVIRRNNSNVVYSSIKVDLSAYNYVVLWEGFVVIPSGHTLIINADNSQVECVANVIEL